jgi:hypothetical protein
MPRYCCFAGRNVRLARARRACLPLSASQAKLRASHHPVRVRPRVPLLRSWRCCVESKDFLGVHVHPPCVENCQCSGCLVPGPRRPAGELLHRPVSQICNISPHAVKHTAPSFLFTLGCIWLPIHEKPCIWSSCLHEISFIRTSSNKSWSGRHARYGRFRVDTRSRALRAVDSHALGSVGDETFPLAPHSS